MKNTVWLRSQNVRKSQNIMLQSLNSLRTTIYLLQNLIYSNSSDINKIISIRKTTVQQYTSCSCPSNQPKNVFAGIAIQKCSVSLMSKVKYLILSSTKSLLKALLRVNSALRMRKMSSKMQFYETSLFSSKYVIFLQKIFLKSLHH